MMITPILSAGGVMRITIARNNILALCLGAVLGCVCTTAEAKIYHSISVYGTPKYEKGFEHFNYTDPKAVKGGRIVMPEYGGFDNFNPYIFKGNPTPQVANLTMDSLGVVSVDDPYSAYPLLAKAFDLPDNKSYVGFILDEKAKFHDGSPVTADDVIFSFNSLIEKGQPLYKVYYADVERVEKISPKEVRFHFRKGSNNRELPLILAQMKIYSAKNWDGKDFSKPTLEIPLGSGPYKLDKFEQGKYLVFRRVPDYWGKDLPVNKGFYNFDEIRFDFYQDTTVTLQALFAGSIDVREEYIAKIWVSGYNNNLVKSGKIIKENMAHNNAAILQMFAFNIRKPMFQDRRVREAIALAFNFDWANDKLFYNQYSRIYSYFTNTGMEATGLPQGKELEILNKYRSKLPKSVFEKAPQNPSHKDFKETRQRLKEAVKLLNEAGYDFVDGKMTNLKTGQPLEFEVLSNSANGSTFTRVMLPFINNLAKIGIKLTFRNLEINIFKNRLDNFDFDMAIVSFGISRMPGNEQAEMWGSKSANIKGSYNMIGIQNEVVDELIKGLITAQDKESYEAYVKALDRVLLNETYMIPNWYSPYQRVAYHDKFVHLKTSEKVGFQPLTWWAKPTTNKDK